MVNPELILTQQPEVSRELARQTLEDVYWAKFPMLQDLVTADRAETMSEEARRQVLEWHVQVALEENRIPQILSHIVYTFGTSLNSLGQRRISSPGFHITLHPRRLDEDTLLAVPSLLHTQLDGYFGASIPLVADYSLDALRGMRFSWHNHESPDNARFIIPIVAARTAAALGMPIDPGDRQTT